MPINHIWRQRQCVSSPRFIPITSGEVGLVSPDSGMGEGQSAGAGGVDLRCPFITFKEVCEASFRGAVVAIVVELEDFFVGTGEGTV